MSYTLQLWEKPADWPWPATKAEADAQFERVFEGPPAGQNPKFLVWGRAMHARYPETMEVWLDGSEDGVTDDPTLGFGINMHSDHVAAAFDHAWEQATLLGLNLYDPQSGVHYLGNGDVPEEPDLQVERAVRARKAGDDAAAWAEYRRHAARGNPHAIYAMGRALRFGTLGQRRHFDLAAVLQLMGAPDEQKKRDAQGFYDRFPDEAKGRIQTLMARLKSASGELLLQIIDSERKAVDDAFVRFSQMALYSRKRIEAADGLEAAATQGHEIAAYEHALEAVTGWEVPNYESARYWAQRAADWDYEPAKRLLAVMYERGWGGAVNAEEAAKWNAAALAQRQQEEKKRQQAQEGGSPGGLSLAPLAPARESPDPASGPMVWTGSIRRDLVGWYAREGHPEAAYEMGLACHHGRHGSPVNPAEARAWYAQAAEAGHGNATYNLAVFIEDGAGGPKDALVAKALFMLANTRGATLRADDLRIAPAEQGPLRALVSALREPGRLRAVLQQRGLEVRVGGRDAAATTVGMAAGVAAAGISASEWGRAGGAAQAAVPTAPAPKSPAAVRSRNPVNKNDDQDSSIENDDRAPVRSRATSQTSFSLHLGHVALAIGVANAVLLIAFVKPGASFRMGMLILGLVAAYGAWRTARDFDWSPVARAVVAVLAAVPLVGMAVCLGLLFKAMRERD